MISFTCPSCNGKCSVGDEFAGRKMKCPKCRTRIRHHKDGQIELLSVGQPPPPAAAAPAPAPLPGAPPDPAATPAAEAKKESTVAVAVVPELVGKLVSQSESKQNAMVIGGIVAFLALVLSGIGMVLNIILLVVAPIAVALGAAFVWLYLRVKRQKAQAIAEEKQKILEEAAETARKEKEEKTEPLPKV